MIREDYGDCWVCTDCYMAHHFGTQRVELDADELGALYDHGNVDTERVALWFAGEDDEPVGGWHEIKVNGTLDHNREPLGLLDPTVEVTDNTCSNHTWDREQECPICDDGDVGEPDGPWIRCWVCDGSGQIVETCPHCGSDSDEDGIQDFSWSRCHGCGSPLGGARYRLHLWMREGATA